jgi:pyruvate-ferredoxin/flavodoxin oxidoreductase
MKNKTTRPAKVFDGNEATANVAYRTNEICIIYPITPASSMGELPDQWSADGLKNIWGTIPQVVTMQSEGGAAGAVHGALQTGALATTFTSSQGLLLMIPNMYRIAGELMPTVFHVATRAIAFHGMSIYGDHSDIYGVRSTGFAMLGSSSVQEAHDMALVTEAASLESRIPFLHFFDGFRTSHEIAKIELLTDEQIHSVISEDAVMAFRSRRLTSENPTIRGVVSDSDVYFQGREAVNPFYDKLPTILEKKLKQFAKVTGRSYSLVEYYGDPQAKRVIVIMGSAAETVNETVSYLNRTNEKVGLLKIRLFRPFPKKDFLAKLPKTCEAIAVLDRTKEVGAAGEPLYEEVTTTVFENYSALKTKKIIGGRYGIASKEFTPAMVKAIFEELKKAKPKNHFTVGINDDLTHSNLTYDKNFDIEPEEVKRAVFYGLGADGTVSANKNTIKIIGEETGLFVQGYFVYDAKKTGSQTVSHLRFGPKKIGSSYLINRANFVGCHQFGFVEKMPILERAAKGATFLLNSPYSAAEVWDKLPRDLQKTIIDKKIKFYVIDAYKVAHDCGLKSIINTIMQTCFFALSNVIPTKMAIAKIKDAIKKTYGKKGSELVQKNYQAVDDSLINLVEVKVPNKITSTLELLPRVNENAPSFVKNVIAKMMAGRGDELPVSALPCDGVYPTHTTRFEKRNISLKAPLWNADNCVQCGLCRIVCPHSAIRSKRFHEVSLKNAPKSFLKTKLRGPNANDEYYTLQVYAEDCTGCGACLEICPINKNNNKALVMETKTRESVIRNKESVKFFESIPTNFALSDKPNINSLQFVPPMFEFCAACAGCGETPYIKLLTQLFGERLIIANGVGCTLAYGGYLPTVPWTVNAKGHGPAFASSLFEDNAEFGYGFLLSIEKQREQALELIKKLAPKINNEKLINSIVLNEQKTSADVASVRHAIGELKRIIQKIKDPEVPHLLSLIDQLVRQSIWEIGGDGWAYDIGYGGLDHVLASGRNIKVLVLDTEVYSNTGGQASKATPRGATVKFAAKGKPVAKKDLGLMLIPYGNIYVASIAIGANPMQAIKAFEEANNYNGPAIIIAYSHCISHGINMHEGPMQQKLAVKCGYWPLYRYNPDRAKQGLNPLEIDSGKPSIPFIEYAKNENRYQILMRSDAKAAERLLKLAEEDIKHRWSMYEALQKI